MVSNLNYCRALLILASRFFSVLGKIFRLRHYFFCLRVISISIEVGTAAANPWFRGMICYEASLKLICCGATVILLPAYLFLIFIRYLLNIFETFIKGIAVLETVSYYYCNPFSDGKLNIITFVGDL